MMSQTEVIKRICAILESIDRRVRHLEMDEEARGADYSSSEQIDKLLADIEEEPQAEAMNEVLDDHPYSG